MQVHHMEVNLNSSYNSRFGSVWYINWSLICNVINKLCCHPQALRKRCAFYIQQRDFFKWVILLWLCRYCVWSGGVEGIYTKGTHTISNILRLYQRGTNSKARTYLKVVRHLQWCLLCFKASYEKSAKNLTFLQKNLHNYQTSLWHLLQQKYCPANGEKKVE